MSLKKANHIDLEILEEVTLSDDDDEPDIYEVEVVHSPVEVVDITDDDDVVEVIETVNPKIELPKSTIESEREDKKCVEIEPKVEPKENETTDNESMNENQGRKEDKTNEPEQKKEEETRVENDDDKTEDEDKDEDTKYFCSYCDDETISFTDLNNHYRHELLNRVENEMFFPEAFECKFDTEEGLPCGYKTGNMINLTNHNTWHFKGNKWNYKCTSLYCTFQTHEWPELEQHKKSCCLHGKDKNSHT